MKKILVMAMVLLIPLASAYFPQQPYANAVAFDYHISTPLEANWVLALYNDTTVYVDEDLDGVYTTWTTLDAGQGTSTSSYGAGARVHGTKPILLTGRYHTYLRNYFSYTSDDARTYGSSEVNAQYLQRALHVPHPLNTIYLFATQPDTNLLIDTANDGTWNINTTIQPNSEYSYASGTVPVGSKIVTDKPFYAKVLAETTTSVEHHESGFVLYNITGTNFYLGAPLERIHVLVLSNDTDVFVDTNGDNIADLTYNQDNGDVVTLTSTSVSESSYLWTTEPVVVTQRYYYSSGDYMAMDYLYPSRKLAHDYFVSYPLYSDIVLGAVSADTNVLIDLENDGTWDTNTTIQPGVANSFSAEVQPGSHIQTDKPVTAYQRSERRTAGVAQSYWGTNLPAGTIAMSSWIDPAPADFDVLINVTNKIWNLADLIHNVTVTGSIPADLAPYPDTSTLNVTVKKYMGINNTLLDNVTKQVPLAGTGPYTYNFNTSLLDDLDEHEYVTFTYQVTTPLSSGVYYIDPFSITIGRASAYKYEWQ